MRLISLDLIAYGNFTDRRLVFPEDKGLHVIYGPNEAGKSTCMRALRGLLYGIPETTLDDFLHESKRLRVGGVLLRSDGERLSVVRRKGRKDTLLGSNGQPIAEDTLRSFLGGVDRETFIRVFGMSREELLTGGRAIMEGKGSVGESLFAAGLGGADLKGLLGALESEAQELFKPGGSLPKLNSEARAYKDLKTKIRELSLPAKEWEDLEIEVSTLENRSSQIKEQIARMAADVDHLKRLRDALPVFAELKDYRKKRADLGEVKVFREGFSSERIRNQSDNTRALSDEKTAQQRIEEIDAEIGTLLLPEDLLAQEKTVQGLVEELGSVLKAQKDLPRVQGQVLEANHAAKGILAEIRPDLSIESAGVLRLTVDRIDRIRRLAEEHGKLTIRRQSAAERVSEYARKLAEAQGNLARLPEVRDVSELERSVVIVRRRGDLEKAYADAKYAAHSVREDAQTALKALTLWSGTLENLEALPLPPEKTVDEFEEAFDAVDDGLRKAREGSADTKGKIGEIDSNLRTLRLAGEPPTEDDLTASREHR
ncbi:MAG: AAA family ATPase, partial [Deltaproteobacteria bacterium]|nr:AAA family ATPase [Deltaproteobacteria bacterium]